MARPAKQSAPDAQPEAEVVPVYAGKELVERYVESKPSYQAYKLLRIGLSSTLIVAGLDKFFYLLAYWNKYLASPVSKILAGDRRTLMLGVGIAEIVLGIGISVKSRLFSYLTAGWISLTILNNFINGIYLETAVYNFGLLMAAVALGRLSTIHESS
jgi:uncharacterized membrane protein YphA (DoxX/SURF4 family)